MLYALEENTALAATRSDYNKAKSNVSVGQPVAF